MTSNVLIKEVTLERQEQAMSVYGEEGGLLTRGVARVIEDGRSVLFIKVEQPGALVHYFFLSRRRRARVETRSNAMSGKLVTWMSENSRYWSLSVTARTELV